MEKDFFSCAVTLSLNLKNLIIFKPDADIFEEKINLPNTLNSYKIMPKISILGLWRYNCIQSTNMIKLGILQ